MEVELLDTFPHYRELGPSEIVAMGGFGTVSADDFLKTYESLSRDEMKRRVRDILIRAVVRGYASMTTSTSALFVIRGSRILDLYITAFPFGSYMVLSQRYVPVERPEVPSWVGKEVVRFIREEIRVYKELLGLGIRREEARGVLGLGTPTHMVAVMSVESVANLVRWGGDHPEIDELLSRLKEVVLASDLADLFVASVNAPAMGGPFPHPFHRKKLDVQDELSVVSYEWNGEKRGVKKYREVLEGIRRDPPGDWRGMVENALELSKISFEHVNEFSVTFSGRIPLTTFNELKRHRTMPIEVEGIYNAMERGDFYVYPSVENEGEARRLYEWVLEGFRELDGNEYELVYALPQSVRIGVRFRLNFAHLTAPSLFYRTRSCDRAEVSMKQVVRRIPYLLKGSVPGYGELLFEVLTGDVNGSRVPLPKCVVGGCPEPDYCPFVRGIVPNYDEELHRRLKHSRKEVFG